MKSIAAAARPASRAFSPDNRRLVRKELTMEMTGEQLIPVPQAEVWRGLNDPEVLKACIAGCESIERVSDTEYRVALTAAVGPVRAKFSGKLLLSDLSPPNSYSLSFEGSGGAAGFGKGGAKVSLQTEGSATRLRYTANASVGGKLAQVGSRLVDGVAKKMADDFFAAFNAKLAGPAVKPAAAAPTRRRIHPAWWVAGAVLVALLIYLVRQPAH
jgi:carbon monoxide dehydrogenase subunit G